MSSSELSQDGAGRNLTFTRSSAARPKTSQDGREISLFEILWEASYSSDVDHACVSASIVPLFSRAMAITRAMAQYLPVDDPEVAAFWEDLGPHFAMSVVGPALANFAVIEAAATRYQPQKIEVVETSARSGWGGLLSLYEQVKTAAPNSPVSATISQIAGNLLSPLATASAASLAGALKHARATSEIAQSPVPDAGHADVLFAAFGAAGPSITAHLLPHLAAEYSLSHAIYDTALGGSTDRLQQLGLKSAHWGAYLRSEPLPSTAREVAVAARIARAVHVPSSADLSEAPALRPLFERLLRALVRRWLPVHRLWNRAAHKTLDGLQPRCLVAFDFYLPLLAPLIRQARERGVTCLFLQHGITSEYYLQSQYLTPYHHFLVYGKYAVEAMQPHLPAGSRVWATGNCLTDLTEQGSVANPPATDGPRAVLAAPQWWQSPEADRHEEVWLTALCEAAKRLQVEVWIRPHPRDAQTERWDKISNAHPHVKIVPFQTHDLRALILQADVTATRCSTVALDALALNKPVMTVDLTGEKERYPYAEDGGTAGVEHAEDIEPTLRRLLEADPDELAPARNRFLLRHLGARDGKATKRVTRLIGAAAQGEAMPDKL
ncbi:MAG: hypothetical protein ACYC63_17245 [Armatimonadota bacterium]